MDDRKSSTMSSIFIGSTLEKPNVELIINAVATILHSQMLEVRISVTECVVTRTLAKARRFHLRVTCFSSLRKNTYSRSQRHLTNRG